MSKAIELLPGQVFGRLTILYQSPNKNGRRFYYCHCICGNELNVKSKNLRSGNTKSCGCYAREVFAKTGAKVGGKNRIIVRDSAFDQLTEESAYWIGFILGDGHIAKNKNSISISLKRDDEEHLLTFANWIEFPGKLKYRKSKGRRINSGGAEWYYGVYISFSSKRIVEVLKKYEITPNKTLTAKAHIDLINNRHFWRGVIDADGSIGRKIKKNHFSPRLNLVGSPILIEQFKNIANNLTQSKASQRKKGIIDDIGYSAYSAVKLIKWLYEDCTVALPRKLKLANELMLWKPIRKQPEPSTIITCYQCNIEFKRFLCQKNSVRNFCSKNCYHKFRSNNSKII